MFHSILIEEQLPSENNSLINKHLLVNSLFSDKNKLRIEPKFFTRFNDFSKIPPPNFDVPMIRNSSPYINEEQVKRQEFLESKKKWLDSKEFKSYYSKASKSDNFIPNYVTMTPSNPPILHKFRVVKDIIGYRTVLAPTRHLKFAKVNYHIKFKKKLLDFLLYAYLNY